MKLKYEVRINLVIGFPQFLRHNCPYWLFDLIQVWENTNTVITHYFAQSTQTQYCCPKKAPMLYTISAISQQLDCLQWSNGAFQPSNIGLSIQYFIKLVDLIPISMLQAAVTSAAQYDMNISWIWISRKLPAVYFCLMGELGCYSSRRKVVCQAKTQIVYFLV